VVIAGPSRLLPKGSASPVFLEAAALSGDVHFTGSGAHSGRASERPWRRRRAQTRHSSPQSLVQHEHPRPRRRARGRDVPEGSHGPAQRGLAGIPPEVVIIDRLSGRSRCVWSTFRLPSRAGSPIILADHRIRAARVDGGRGRCRSWLHFPGRPPQQIPL